MSYRKKTNTKKAVLFALLTAILILMAFTPIGYLRVGVVEITFMMIPVIIGACALGTAWGAGLGLVFGITSLLQCFGVSAFGTMLFNINPWLTTVLCIVPRVLFGLLSGLIFEGLKKTKINLLAIDSITMLSGAVIHTALFSVLFYLCFGSSQEFAVYGNDFFTIVWALVGINGIIEWAVCLVAGTAVLKATQYFYVDGKRLKKVSKDTKSEGNSGTTDDNGDDK